MISVPLCIAFNMDVKVATHVPEIENVTCDRLSRIVISGEPVQDIIEECGLGKATIVNLSAITVRRPVPVPFSVL